MAGVIGGSGGMNIIPAVTEVFINYFILGMNAVAAVQSPRVYHKVSYFLFSFLTPPPPRPSCSSFGMHFARFHLSEIYKKNIRIPKNDQLINELIRLLSQLLSLIHI